MWHLNTIIIQTHITLTENYYFGTADCYTYPMSATTKSHLFNNSVPTLPMAEKMVESLRRKGDLFDIVFTSSMGVMVYRTRGPKLTGFKEPCGSFLMGNFDMSCENDTILKKTFDDTEMTSYGVDTKGEYLITFDDEQAIRAKLDKYLHGVSNGWCLYEIDRDVYWNCPTHPSADPLQRVKNVSDYLKSTNP
ncbi:uncharacterized protein LOC144148450 [Haemaphysalis longicornis]